MRRLRISWKVIDSITEAVVISCDEAALLTVQGMTDLKFDVVAIVLGRWVWGIYAIS